MTEPSPSRPVPGPPRPGPRTGETAADEPATQPPAADDAQAQEAFADLDERPVVEHVAVFEAEHARLQRELGTIDEL